MLWRAGKGLIGMILSAETISGAGKMLKNRRRVRSIQQHVPKPYLWQADH